jgi:uncharacterized protein YutE (UPF0331/DUF86 family)
MRTLKTKVPKENGIHNWTWYMDEAGVNRPSRKIRKQTRESGGVSVKPGIYKAVLHYGDQISETKIEVKSDPRLDVSQKNIDEVYAASKQLETLQETAANAVKQLVESKTIAETYKTNLFKLDKEGYKDEIKASKKVVKSIDSLIDKYLGKVDKRQGITRNPEVTPLQRLGTASYYVSSSQTGLTSTETTLMKHAKELMQNNSGSGATQTGVKHCRRCGRKITDPDSIRRGYGLACYKKVNEKNELKLF